MNVCLLGFTMNKQIRYIIDEKIKSLNNLLSQPQHPTQHNLNTAVGLDTKMALHTTHHHHPPPQKLNVSTEQENTLQSNRRPYGFVWLCIRPYKTIKDLRRPYRSVQDPTGLCRSIQVCTSPYTTKPDHTRATQSKQS